MKVGIHYANFSHPGWQTQLEERLVETARLADDGGVHLLTLMDHWFQMEDLGGPEEPMLEGYTTLGYLAALTERLRLSLLVTGVTYRHPGLLAKTVATLDRLSRGRAQLGIGAAWYDREHAGLGVPFPPLAERFERLEETLRICRQMWGPENGPFDGTHYQLAETVCVPPPYAESGPPIMVGGSGERKTLRLVAQYADACNLFGTDAETVAAKLTVLRSHCEAVGRDYGEIQKTVLDIPGPPAGGGDASFDARMAGYADLGVELVMFMPAGDDPAAWTAELVDRVVPQLAAL